MRKFATTAAFVLLVGLLASLAQTSSGSNSVTVAATREDILRLFDVMQLRQQMREVMKQVMEQTRAVSREQIKKRQPDVTEEELAKIDALSEQTMKDMPVEGMLEDVIPVYQKHLNKSDVDAMIGFYSSSSGQKLLREMPAITRESMQAMYPRLQQQMQKAMDRVDQMVKEEQGKSAPPAQQPEKK